MSFWKKLFGVKELTKTDQLIDRWLEHSIAIGSALEEIAKFYPNNSALSKVRLELANSVNQAKEAPQGERLPVVFDIQQALSAVDNIVCIHNSTSIIAIASFL
jgi:hypothetical protein